MSIGTASLSAALRYDSRAQLMVVQYRDSSGAVRVQTPTNAAIRLEEPAGRQEPSHAPTAHISIIV